MQERLVADPRRLGADEENLPPEERARRERVRETAAGIVAYATDRGAKLAVFALSGQVYAVPLGSTTTTATAATPRLDPGQGPGARPQARPAGTRVAYVHDGALRVIDLETGEDTVIAQEEGVTFGLRSSSPPRRWAGPAATGGPPMAASCSWRAWTSPPWRAGTSPIPPTRTRPR